jgi:hypothetical protein
MTAQTLRASELLPGDVARLAMNPETVERITKSDDGDWLYVYTEEVGDEAAHVVRPHHLVEVESREG